MYICINQHVNRFSVKMVKNLIKNLVLKASMEIFVNVKALV